ncbi:hypothetical protein HPB51_029854 [Rhipicephalus microplus]|uniref:Tick transposon n=1 Tax=Rhipicephalus microplus TaxID=6941 RepID=A0A9J6CT99_RHIMP|nr:hypothetical protein HPB51_029854 [Rhipicephalus microplus]
MHPVHDLQRRKCRAAAILKAHGSQEGVLQAELVPKGARKLSWFLKNAQCPMEVLLVCGWLPPSEGHARRISKIMRSESRRQVRHFKDCLRVACSSVSDGRLNVKAFREWCRQASILTEAMWNDVRRGLPRKKRDPPKGGLLLLGDAVVEERQQKVLRLGPKFCVEPRLDLVDKLSLTRDIARQVPEKEKDRCVVECVDVVAKASGVLFVDAARYPLSAGGGDGGRSEPPPLPVNKRGEVEALTLPPLLLLRQQRLQRQHQHRVRSAAEGPAFSRAVLDTTGKVRVTVSAWLPSS